jgi:hypothetical protein
MDPAALGTPDDPSGRCGKREEALHGGKSHDPLELVESETAGTGTLILTHRSGATPAADQQRTD